MQQSGRPTADDRAAPGRPPTGRVPTGRVPSGPAGQRYRGAARLLHWLTAAVVLLTMPVGFVLLELPAGVLQDTLFDLHRSVGILVLVLVVLRIGYRLKNPPPPLPDDLAAWQHMTARWAHRLLYTLLIAMPILGWWGTSAYGAPIKVFWLFELPPLVAPDRAVAERVLALHGWIGLLFSATIMLHVAAALHHHFVRRDDVLRRML